MNKVFQEGVIICFCRLRMSDKIKQREDSEKLPLNTSRWRSVETLTRVVLTESNWAVFKRVKAMDKISPMYSIFLVM